LFAWNDTFARPSPSLTAICRSAHAQVEDRKLSDSSVWGQICRANLLDAKVIRVGDSVDPDLEIEVRGSGAVRHLGASDRDQSRSVIEDVDGWPVLMAR
jgi:hypothetical protein